MKAIALRRRLPPAKGNGVLLDDGTGKREKRVALPVRAPESLLDYVRERAGWKKVHGKWQKGSGEVTAVIEEALRLHQHLHRTLVEHKFRLQQVAIHEELDWSTQAAELYGRLILRGLQEAERSKK